MILDNHRLLLAPSLLSCDFAHLAEEIARVEAGGADLLHIDVMDGHFVPNLTIGPVVVQAIKRVSHIPLDVHLMISHPQNYLERFIRAGSDSITFHLEAVDDPRPLLETLAQAKIGAGIAIKPATDLIHLLPFLSALDLVLIMSVEPGFGGQTFMPHVLDKVKELRQILSQAAIAIDGGIHAQTARQAIAAGVNILVAGHAIFSTGDPGAALRTLRQEAQEAWQVYRTLRSFAR